MSRSIMLRDLSVLLDIVPIDARHATYAESIVMENCLGKPTVTTRRKSLGHLSRLYALDPDVILFRVFRDLWRRDQDSCRLLAMLLALARDPLLRATFSSIARTPVGSCLGHGAIRAALTNSISSRMSAISLAAVVARASSSWAQSGHLSDPRNKTRQKVNSTPAATTFALLIGFALGRRGPLMFETPWTAVLDSTQASILDLAYQASRLGLLNLRHYGEVTEVTFTCLLTSSENKRIHGLL